MIRKFSFLFVALSLPLLQQVSFAADTKWDEERSAGQSAYNASNLDRGANTTKGAATYPTDTSDTAIIHGAAQPMSNPETLGEQNPHNRFNCDIKTNQDAVQYAQKAMASSDDRSKRIVTINDSYQLPQGKSGGVGLRIGRGEDEYDENEPATGPVKVYEVAQGSPSEKAGLKKGDCIIRVNGADIQKLPIKEVVLLIRGKAGTEVELTIESRGGTKKVAITRGELMLEEKSVGDSIIYTPLLGSEDEKKGDSKQASVSASADDDSRVLEQAVSRMEAVAGTDKADLASGYLLIAKIYLQRGQHKNAEPLCDKALAIYEKTSTSDHPDVANCFTDLAGSYSALGRYLDAENLYGRALAIYEKTKVLESPEVAQTLNDLALIYHKQGRYKEAEPMYKRALAINQRVYGPNHPKVATTTNNLAALYKYQGYHQEAERLYKMSLNMRKNALGLDHSDVAASLNNLAALYYSQGRHVEAEPLYKKALALHEAALGENHPDVANAVNNLALLYDTQQRYAEAEPLYRRALTAREKALGPGHPDVGATVNNLALLYYNQGRHLDAELLYKNALIVREAALGPNHTAVAESLHNLALLYDSQERHSEAEPLYKRALAIFEKAFGPDHPSSALSIRSLAELYRSQGRYPEAEPLYKRALAICEKALGPDHPDTAASINNLAALYDNQGRYPEAEPLYKRALAIEEKRLGVRREIDYFVKAAGRARFSMVVPLENLSRREISRKGATKSDDSLDLSGENRQALAQGFDSEVNCLKLLQADPCAEVMSRLGNILATREKAFGKDDPRSAEVLMQLGILSEALGGSSKKQANTAYEPLSKFGRALCDTASGASNSKTKSDISTVVESMGGDENARYFSANALLCLGNLLASNDEVEKAKDAFNISEKCFLAQSNASEGNLLKNLLTLSESWMNLGEYPRAQELADKASALAASNIAKYDCSVFDARLKLEQADYAAAFESAKSSLAAAKEAVSTLNSDAEKSQALLDSYKIAIESSLSMGKLKEAKEFADQALSLKDLNKQGRAYLLVLKGTIDFQESSFEEAQEILEQLSDLNDGDKEIDQTTFTQAATIKGFVLERLGKFSEAQRSFNWALSWDKKNPSSDGLLATARDYNGLALIEADRVAANDKDADADRAKYYALEGSQRIDKYIKTAFPGLSIGQQCAFLSVAKQQRDAILTTCQKRESIGPAYSMMMRWKGLLLESLRTKGAIKAAVQDNPALKEKQEQLESKIRLLASLSNKGGDTAGGDSKEQYRRETAERERLEREISAASGVVLKDPLSDIGSDGFRGLLNADEAFIDILPYKPLNEESEHYAVVAMKKGPNGEPQFFDLGKRDEIDETVRKWRFGATGSKSELERDINQINAKPTSKMDPKEFDALTTKLSDLLISNAKLQEYLGSEIKRIWLCPEGEFGRVPWTAIALLRGITNQSTSEVDSPREFAFLRMDRGTIANSKRKNSSKVLLAGLSDFQKAGLNNLDGALKEVEALKTLADTLRRDVDYLPEYDATKESVKSKLTTVANAHIATHGFAGSSNTASDDDRGSRAVRFTMRDGGGIKLATARNPLSECGIYLAYPKSTSNTTNDTTSGDQTPNILTADEIIGLDLSNCDILTLSACETGLGRTLSGQGVIGLRSAIIGAGAKAVLMSLWSVPDDATQELMKRFYSNLWKEGMKKQDALADAQNYIRQQAKWKEPKNWAAWVLVGE